MSTPTLEPPTAAADPTEEELRAFVGPNAGYYLRHWYSGKTSFHWAAFLVFAPWLGYRRMYSGLAAILALCVALTVADEALARAGRVLPEGVVRGASIGLAVAIALNANQFYYWHARRAVEAVRKQNLPPDEHLAELRRRGGASLASALGATALIAVVMVGVSHALDAAG